ncbi:MAG: hypothetical protein LBJ97_03845 [Mycoplasmataceae bacterium]|nr:hypothetical protein [Mycoplasmataceae bacterium]
MAESFFNNETLHVVDYFNGALKDKNKQIIIDTFNQLILGKSKIDINANRTTADKIIDLDKNISRESKEVKHSHFWMNFMRTVGIIWGLIGIFLILFVTVINPNFNSSTFFLILGPVLIALGALVFGLSWLVKKSYLKNRQELDQLQSERTKEFNVSQDQLKDLKSHIYYSLTQQIFEKTYPLISFAKYFSEADYLNWTSWLKNDVNSSTLYCLSGTLNTNPFIVLKTKSTEMYDHVYTGSVTVMVRRTRYVNGRSQSYMVPKVITASTTNPAPRYWTDTKLFYKSNAAESLNFVNLSEFRNERKAEKFFKKNKQMENMDNPEFDRYFPCERDNEQQFRTLFSPLAQEEMVKLMKVKNNYRFTKKNTINIIESPSFESIKFDVNYNSFFNYYDYEQIKNDFIAANQTYFQDIYFMFAPILTIPLYQQYPYRQPIFEKAQQRLLSFVQNETVVNTMYDSNLFAHSSSVTENILKTKRVFANSLYEINEIIAYGYRSQSRIKIIVVSDFEAGPVSVPVTVIDYFAVQKSTNVINSLVDKNEADVNDTSFQAVWKRYMSSLNVSNANKKGSIVSMLAKDKNPINADSYKNFLRDLNN